MEVTAKSILRQKRALIRDIRAYAEAQKELWRRVPYLALHADGRSGYNEYYAWAYRQGIWALSPQDGNHRIFVDCATGRLVRTLDPGLRRAWDDDVFMLAQDLEQLNASRIVAELEARAKEPHVKSLLFVSIKTRNEWRRSLVTQLKLTPEYVRHKK